MHREEADQLGVCADCGAPIEPGSDRSYAFGEAATLCWDCAVRRGGRYDAAQERWSDPPRVSDLLEREPTPR